MSEHPEDISDEESAVDSEEEDNEFTINTKKKSVIPNSDDEDSDEESEINDDENEKAPDANSDDDAADSDGDIDGDAIRVKHGSNVASRLGLSDDDEDNDEEEDDEDNDEDDDEKYMRKFEDSMRQNIIQEFHPEMNAHNNEEIEIMSRIVRNEMGIIVDPLHTTLPFITKYEIARVLGERAKQLNSGAKPFIEDDPEVIDGYLIALDEFEQKKIPFIIRRPLPNGGCEYWKLADLEVLSI